MTGRTDVPMPGLGSSEEVSTNMIVMVMEGQGNTENQ